MHRHRFFHSFVTTSHLLLIATLVGALLATPTRVARAATLAVDITNESCDNASGQPYCNIQPAIDDAQPGDTINVASGQYDERLTIGKSLTIAGAGVGKTLIDAGFKGRAIDIDGSADVTIAGVTIRHGAANNGAGIRNASTLTLSASEVTGNQADGNGGGINNSAGATLTLNNSSIFDNQAGADGGGIFGSGTLVLTNSTISGNQSGGNGGGIAATSGALDGTNITISGNQANGNGGGIFSSASVALASATVTENSSVGSETQGGGIYHGGQGGFTLRNTILARNNGASSADCSGTLTSQGYNLVGDDSGCAFQAAGGDQVGRGDGAIDPLLGQLAGNGGPTPTHALLEGSPAIDAGNPTVCPASDQRGVVRPQGRGCDIGAFESSFTVGGGETRYVAINGRDRDIETQNDCLNAADPCRTIGHAIDQASPGDTISIAAGIYRESLSLDENLALEGAGAGATMIDGGGQSRVITINAGVVARIAGVQIQNGNTTNQDLSDGGGIRNDGVLILSESVVSGNTSGGQGGGIYNSGALTLDGSRVQGNSASSGGGIYSAGGGSLTASRSTISGNRSLGAGGGIQNDGTLTLTDGTISGNLAVGRGGGVENNNALTFTNVTISGNLADRGGGIANGGGGANVGATTIADNRASTEGGGIVVDDGAVNLRNTILAGNTGPAAPECAGAPTSQGNNLVGDTSGCGFTAAPSDLIGQDPRLGALRDNGGSTFTQAIPPGSPAAGAGDPSACPAADQRGAPRPQGGACDIGAYEVRVFRPRPLEFGDRSAPRLVFTTQPTGTVAGEQLVPAPEVAVRDALGNPAGYTGSITLTLVNNDNVAGAALSGTTVLTPDSAGVARFEGLSINQAGTGYQLLAEATGVLSAESALLIVALAETPSQPEPEHEPNNTIEQPNPLVFDSNGFTARVGLITTTDILTPDIDVFSFWAQPGSTAIITLTGENGGDLPADYDLLIAPDPRNTLWISDEIDLDNLADLPRGGVPRGGVPRGGVPRGGVPRGGVPRGGVSNISETVGAGPEKLKDFVSVGGRYFIMVYGGEATEFNLTQRYRLDVTLRDSPLVLPAFRAHPIAQLNLAPDRDVRTIYIQHPLRLQAHYPGPGQSPSLGALASALSPGSALLASDSTIGKGKGATIDLRAALLPDDYNDLNALYNQWDEQGQQPLLANEAALQIWYALDRALTTYYTGTTDIVLVGGDGIVPFYRVPDETELANEQDYYNTLAVTDVFSTETPLGGSLFFSFIQTDNFYADRRPTPWRGRALYLPDMGIGRLVEQPSDIMHYLNGYLADANYTIDAQTPPVADTGVLVTGYDFLVDQAEAISSTFELLGFQIGGTPALSTTIGQTWDAQALADQWFSGQLDQLKDGYNPDPEQPDIYTRYHLTALNGHFDHTVTVPATGTEVFSAGLLLNATAAVDSAAFFKIHGAPTLIYSIGCHSGMNAADGDFSDPEFQVDFPQAVLKQGGNWIGNTGYGIGDTELIGYSEKLSLKFTEAIGREITDTLATDSYVGAPIGLSLASAKIQYLRSAGSNTFSVYDEKILAEMTLYGLPFIRVRVPQPLSPPDLPAIPESTWKPRLDAEGMFTRTITLDTTFITGTLPSGDQIVRAAGQVHDEFRPTTTVTLTSENQTPLGRPVLPLVAYDITLQADRATASGSIPVPRGVRLLSVETQEDVDGFDPHVTSAVSDVVGLPPAEPELTEPGLWAPGVPFATQRTAEDVPGVGVQLTDRLLIYPAQFSAGDTQTGQLRRFSRMVFEITYLDPTSATPALQNLRQAPRIALAEMEVADDTVRLSAMVGDESGRGMKLVTALYTTDGVTWQHASLAPQPQPGRWETALPSLGHSGFAFFMASDNAGHVSAVPVNAVEALSGSGVQVRPAHAAHFMSADFYLDDQLLDDSIDSREVQEYLAATPGVHRVYLRPEHSHPTSPVLFAADTPPLLDGHDYTLIIVGRPGALGLVVVDETAPTPPPGQSLMHFVNANRTEPGWNIGPIDVYLDGALQAAALPVGQTSAGFIAVAPGTHTVWFFQAGRDPEHDDALYRKTFVVNAGELLLVGTGRHDDDDGDLSDFEQRGFIGRATPR
jgi:hypothetical protein